MRILMMAAGVCALALLATAGHAQEAPAPPAEMKRLDFLLGSWKLDGSFSGEMTGKLTGTATMRSVAGGHFIVRESTSHITAEGMPDPITIEDLTIIRYDAAAKQFVLDAYDAGPGFTGTGAIDKGTFVMSFPPDPGMPPGGFRVTVKPDGKDRLTSRAEVSEDGGKTWSTVLDLKYTRAPAPR